MTDPEVWNGGGATGLLADYRGGRCSGRAWEGTCGAGDAVQEAWSRGRMGGWGGEVVTSVSDPNLQGRWAVLVGVSGRQLGFAGTSR